MAKPTDIKGKIRHLLALAESPNENEARAALLKARELMARHKLTEAELGEAERQAVRKLARRAAPPAEGSGAVEEGGL